MITPSTNSVVTARFAGAMYNLALDYSTTQQVLASTAAPGAMTDLENQLFIRDFSNMATGDVATIVATNLGLTGDAFDAAVVFLTGWITGTVFTERGAVIAQIVNNFSLMTSDPTFGTFATAWNTKVGNAVAYSANSSSTASVAFGNVPTAPEGSFTLTNGTDIATANIFTAGLVYTPGGDDRINSLQDEDQLTGTGTSPTTPTTLNATLGNANDNGATIITPKLTGIEVINTAFTGSGGAAVVALDLQDATGQTEVNITRISQAINSAEVGNLMTPAATLSLANTNANQLGTAEFSYGAGVLQGPNAGSLKVSNVQIGTLNVGENTSAIGARGVGLNGFEELALTSTGGASNTIGILGLPMDTGTAGKLTITGDQNLALGAPVPVILGNTVESLTYQNGVTQANGRLSAIDASGFTKNLTLNIQAGLLSAGKADTSGVPQNVTITGGSGNDKFILGDTVQAGDSLTGGAGTDTLIVTSAGTVNSVSSVVTSMENLEVRASAGGAVTVDFDKLPDTLLTLVRNEGSANNAPLARTLVTNLNNLTAVEAAALNTQHSNTGSNGITQNTINATLKTAAGATDLVSLTIAEGLNIDPRFNLTLGTQNAPGATGAVENVTLVDSDTESNTVALSGVAQHTGKVVLTGGLAGTFLNLDTTTAGANGGIYQYETNGAADLNSSNAGPTVARIADQSLTAGQVKLVAATIDAAAEVSNVVVRVSTNALSVVGAQNIAMGSGNDTVIFDNVPAGAVPDTRAGLTISDTVTGGAGNDTLAVDGQNTPITLGASEWTNVSGFETIRLVGDGAAANNAAGAVNSYNLTLTNNLLATNKDSNGSLAIVADNDLFNNTGRTAAQAAVPVPVTNQDGTVVGVPNDAGLSSGGVTLDARTLNAGSKWSFKGNEGPGRSADRIIMSDANIDGNAIIDGGAIDNITNNSGIASLNGTTVVGNGVVANLGNADVIEVRNAAVVAQGDLANVKNIGTLSFVNDLAVTQVSTLQLNDSIVDSMVDSYQASVSRAAVATQTTGGANVEILTINALDNLNVAGATTGLTIQAETLTDKSDLGITLGRGANNVATGGGQDNVVLLGNYLTGVYAGVVNNGVDINAQANVAVGVVPTQRVITDTINLGGGVDTLTTYGAINLAGATLTGIENIVFNSDVTLTQAQYNALSKITFVGATPHTLTITDTLAANPGGADPINLSKIVDTTSGNITITNNAVEGATGTLTAGTGTGGTNTVTGGAPTYALTPSAASVNEGSSVTFNLATTNVAAGTVLNYVLSGTGITTADTTVPLEGTLTVGATGAASLVVIPTADVTTEGTETLTMTITGTAATSNVSIIDTSTTPPGPVRVPVNLAAGTVTANPAVAEAFTYAYQMVGGRATNAGDNEVTINGFDPLTDSLVFEDSGVGTVFTEAQFAVLPGVSINADPFANQTTLFLDPNGGVAGGVTLTGIQDAALTQIVLETLA
ncbi:beta strand repeat-containing protein [Candidatus Accumulibacter contiguus]|jgi:hypothetical protein|uniref:beta strand repeat-containing protein n=1 Tax=Candidatus Accumulibacter contiguus TaxID=2954381 RepID=UPI002FC307B7